MRKRLLFVIQNMNRGGAQRVLVNLVNNLDSSKYEIKILAICNDGDIEKELNPSIKYESIVSVKNKQLRMLFSFLIRRIIPPAIVARYYFRGGYDYEIAYLEGESTRLVAAHQIERNKKIAWVHVDLTKITGSRKAYKSDKENQAAYEKFGKIVCVSEALKRSFISLFGNMDSLQVVYNVIDEKCIENKLHEFMPHFPDNGLNVLMVGNCRKQKSYDRMLYACKQLKDDGLKFSVTVLGGGSEEDTLKQLCNDLELTDTVLFLGAVKNPYPYMKAADILLCSSIQEGFSTVVIEALLIGLPTVTTDCAGMSEILDNGKYGLIVENSQAGVYEGLKKCINNPKLIENYKKTLPERKSFFSTTTRIEEVQELFDE